MINVSVPVNSQQNLVGGRVQQRLHLCSVVDAVWTRQGLMRNNEDRALEVFQLFLEPLKLLLSNVRGITPLMVLRFLLSIEDNQIHTVNILGVVTSFHSPELCDRIKGVSAINLVVS